MTAARTSLADRASGWMIAATRIVVGLLWLRNAGWKTPTGFGGLRGYVNLGIKYPVFPPFSWGLEHLVLREHHRLQRPRHAPVAVAERVDHHQIQVRHRRAHQSVARGIAESSHEVPHQLWYAPGRGSFVHVAAQVVVVNVDRAGAIAAR